MANVDGTFYSGQTGRPKSSPESPPDLQGEQPFPVNPPGTNPSHDPLTIGTPPNGLSLSGQELSLGLSSTSTIGALSDTDWNTFNSKIGGTIVSGQVAFGAGAGTIGGDNNFKWDSADISLRIGDTGKIKSYNSLNYIALESLAGNNLRITTFGDGDHLGINSGNTIVSSIYIAANYTTKNAFVELRSGNFANNIDLTQFTRLEQRDNGLHINLFSGFYWIDGGPFIFNSDNNDYDFRIDGLSVDNLIRTDAQNGRVGFSTDSPTDTIDINGTARIRTIANSVGDFLTVDVNGKINKRTSSETLNDIGGIGGSGTINYIPKFTASGTIENSQIIDNGTTASGIEFFSNINFYLVGSTNVIRGKSTNNVLVISGGNSTANGGNILLGGSTGSNNIQFRVGSSIRYYTDNSGFNGINTNAPTNTLDVNGTARIRTINNLGSTPASVLVPSATGVVSSRTLAEFKTDLGLGSTITGSGTTNYVPKWNSSSTLNNSVLYQGGSTRMHVLGYLATTAATSGTPSATLSVASQLNDFETASLWLRNLRNNVDSNPTTFYESIRMERVLKTSTTFPSMATMAINRYEASGQNGRTGFSFKMIHGSFSNPEREIYRIHSSAEWFFYDGSIFNTGTTTGLKIGATTSDKISFWNKTPIVQPTTAITGATLVGGGGTTITDTDTFGGYTLAQLAAIIINTGLAQ